jgi:hypothetical protein
MNSQHTPEATGAGMKAGTSRWRRCRLAGAAGATAVATTLALALGAAVPAGASLASPSPIVPPPIAPPPILPPVMAPPPAYQAPTANLTKVANALSLRNKSVTTVVQAAAGLKLTNRVNINVYFAAYSHYETRQTQRYVGTTGNRFSYSFPELDGLARPEDIQVILSERTRQGAVNFTINWHLDNVQPLYDVSVSPLSFHLNNDCDWIGDSEPMVVWVDPGGQYHENDFSLGGGGTRALTDFASTWTEVGMGQGRIRPAVTWQEDDPFEGPHQFDVGPTSPLLPGRSYSVSQVMNDAYGNDCNATLSWQVTYTLRTYAL